MPGERACAQTTGVHPGSTCSKGHEAQDAATFASWGVDYLKDDWCSSSGTRDEQVARFTLMRDALRATGRPIVYSINPNSFHAITGATYNWGEVADLGGRPRTSSTSGRTATPTATRWTSATSWMSPHRSRRSRARGTGTTPTCSSSAAPA